MQGITINTEPQATAAPAAPAAVTTTTADGRTIKLDIPQSETDVEALYSRRQDIRDQLSTLSSNRRSLVEQIRSAPEGVARTGLEQRISLIDQNILQYERELNSISMRLDAAPSELLHGYAGSSGSDVNRAYNNGWEEGTMFGFGMSAVALAAVWLFRRWRGKKKRKNAPPVIEANESPRLERLEQGMEAIAIEVERISEGQRFMTKLMSESRDAKADARLSSA